MLAGALGEHSKSRARDHQKSDGAHNGSADTQSWYPETVESTDYDDAERPQSNCKKKYTTVVE